MSILKACETLELLSQTSGRLDKEKILKENESEELKDLLELAFNPYLTFGVKDFKVNIYPATPISTSSLMEVSTNLRFRRITGNAAKEYLENSLKCNEPLICKWLEATFKKNIKCGIDVKTINKVFPKLIPTFEVGLCETFKGENLPEGEWAVEYKLDGSRCLVFIDEDYNVSFKSRSGKELYNLEHIAEELKCFKNMVFDGEIYAGDWNNTMSIIASDKTGKDKDTKSAKLYVFATLTLEEWLTQKAKPYKEQMRLDNAAFKYVEMIPSYPVYSFDELAICYEDALNRGYEGVVLKEINSSYPFKRSKNWLKYKPVITEDLEIIGYEEGKGRNQGRLGKFICNFKGHQVDVGGGFSDALRKKFWQERDEMVGKIIEVKAQEETKEGSLRFPIFVRLRLDK
jgi:DNA ligase-1